jgi:pyroglutamyl-peptidase
MSAATGTARRPRVLVTGFSSFPGAPANPTERLIAELSAREAELSSFGEVRLVVLQVEYLALPAELARLGAEFHPDIAIHFGLSGKASGFMLERLARNVVGESPDNAGHVPDARTICALAETLPSTLPLEPLHAKLSAAGLPVDWSDDAGDYLCNYLFYHSRSALAEGFAPAVSGFVHVPPVAGDPDADGGGGIPMGLDQLVQGALAIVETAAEDWRTRHRL